MVVCWPWLACLADGLMRLTYLCAADGTSEVRVGTIGWSHDSGYCDWTPPKGNKAPRGEKNLAEACTFTYASSFRLSLSRFPRLARQCLLLLLRRRPRCACPPSLARAGKRKSTSTSMRNRHPPIAPPIAPDRTFAAQGAPANPEAPFLPPSVRLKSDPPSPALPHTPQLQRSPMPNRGLKSPHELHLEPKNLLFRRTRNRTTISPESRPSLIVPAQSSLVEIPSEAGLATDGGWAWDAKTKTRKTSSQR